MRHSIFLVVLLLAAADVRAQQDDLRRVLEQGTELRHQQQDQQQREADPDRDGGQRHDAPAQVGGSHRDQRERGDQRGQQQRQRRGTDDQQRRVPQEGADGALERHAREVQTMNMEGLKTSP